MHRRVRFDHIGMLISVILGFVKLTEDELNLSFICSASWKSYETNLRESHECEFDASRNLEIPCNPRLGSCWIWILDVMLGGF
jgi:hypothetical protein